jgi:hypothetical protein
MLLLIFFTQNNLCSLQVTASNKRATNLFIEILVYSMHLDIETILYL